MSLGYGGLFGRKQKQPMRDSRAVPEQPPLEVTGQQQRPGLFQRPSTHRGIATFADTLAKLRSGVDLGLTHGINQRDRQKFEEAQYEKRRSDDFQDQMRMEEYKRNNPSPTALQKDFGYFQSLDEDQRNDLGRLYDMKTPKLVQDASGRHVSVRRSSGPQVGSIVDGYRFKGGDPNSQASWEKAGGGAGNSAGNFQQ